MVSIDASNGVKINGATVVKADIGASNGVIHVIDTVILPKMFLSDRVGPLVEAIGQQWADSTLEIRHEHFLTEQLGELLRAPLDDRATGPTAVLATLPGEQHGLGLLMAALALAASGLRVRVAGTDCRWTKSRRWRANSRRAPWR